MEFLTRDNCEAAFFNTLPQSHIEFTFANQLKWLVDIP